MSDRRGAQAYTVPPVRMGMGAAEAEIIADLYDTVPAEIFDQVVDQLWLRSVFVEQRRRTNVSERVEFDVHANRILEQLDPQDPPARECGRLLVGQGDDTYDPTCTLARGHAGVCRP